MFAAHMQSLLMKGLLPVLAATLAFTACAPDGPQLSENGYEYTFHNDAPGEPIGPGGAGSYYLTVFKNDSLLQSSRSMSPDPSEFMLPTPEEMGENPQPNPMIDMLQLMSVGDSVSVYIKMDTIENRPDGFAAEDRLRYDIVLAEQKSREEYEAEQAERRATMERQLAAYTSREPMVADSTATELAAFKRGAKRAGYTTTASGLMYKILEPGTGKQAVAGKPVLVSYYGVRTADGSMFDNSFRAQRPIDFPLGRGQVIPGWDEGIGLLREGARAILAIPAELAYGDNPRPGGPIKPGDELMFYVQLEEVAQ